MLNFQRNFQRITKVIVSLKSSYIKHKSYPEIHQLHSISKEMKTYWPYKSLHKNVKKNNSNCITYIFFLVVLQSSYCYTFRATLGFVSFYLLVSNFKYLIVISLCIFLIIHWWRWKALDMLFHHSGLSFMKCQIECFTHFLKLNSFFT